MLYGFLERLSTNLLSMNSSKLEPVKMSHMYIAKLLTDFYIQFHRCHTFRRWCCYLVWCYCCVDLRVPSESVCLGRARRPVIICDTKRYGMKPVFPCMHFYLQLISICVLSALNFIVNGDIMSVTINNCCPLLGGILL